VIFPTIASKINAMRSFIFILSCVLLCGTLKAQKDSSKFSLHDAWLIAGVNVTPLNPISVEEIRGFAKPHEASFLDEDITNYKRSFGYRSSAARTAVSSGVSFRYRDPEKKWQNRSRFRISLSYNRNRAAVSGCDADSVFTVGTVTTAGQPTFVVEKHKRRNFEFAYYANSLQAEMDHLFTTSQDKLVSLYFGYSIGLGATFASYIEAVKSYQEYDSEAKGSPQGVYYSKFIKEETYKEKIKAKSGIVGSVGMPMGIQVRLSKKRKQLSHINLGLEIKPRLSCFYINNTMIPVWQYNFPIIPSIRYRFH